MDRKNIEVLRKFGEKVKRERIKKNLSQEQFGLRAGLHRTYIGMIERAEKNITLINIYKISRALNCSIKDLFSDDD